MASHFFNELIRPCILRSINSAFSLISFAYCLPFPLCYVLGYALAPQPSLLCSICLSPLLRATPPAFSEARSPHFLRAITGPEVSLFKDHKFLCHPIRKHGRLAFKFHTASYSPGLYHANHIFCLCCSKNKHAYASYNQRISCVAALKRDTPDPQRSVQPALSIMDPKNETVC